MEASARSLQGRDVIPALAEIYSQLYLTPGEQSREEYDRIVKTGYRPTGRSLAHIPGSEEDSLLPEQTPAGVVAVITLARREDFECFLQIMAHRCMPDPIPPTQGAAILDGVVNWTKIREHKAAYLAAEGAQADWSAEFARFTADKRNYRDALIILSAGPYSAVSAQRAGFDEAEWLKASHTIRRAHECTHFICRRLYPDRIDAVWDELVADAVGICAALGRFDPALEELFLGVSESGYTGGRLENYVDGPENRQERLDLLAKKVHRTLCRFEKLLAAWGEKEPYELAIRLEEEIGCWKQL